VTGDKTPLKVCPGKVDQDYESLWTFDFSAYYHTKEDKLDMRARKSVFVGFKKGVKDYQIWNTKDKKIILSRNVTFNNASIVKPKDSKQLESEKTNMISQQIESDIL